MRFILLLALLCATTLAHSGGAGGGSSGSADAGSVRGFDGSDEVDASALLADAAQAEHDEHDDSDQDGGEMCDVAVTDAIKGYAQTAVDDLNEVRSTYGKPELALAGVIKVCEGVVQDGENYDMTLSITGVAGSDAATEVSVTLDVQGDGSSGKTAKVVGMPSPRSVLPDEFDAQASAVENIHGSSSSSGSGSGSGGAGDAEGDAGAGEGFAGTDGGDGSSSIAVSLYDTSFDGPTPYKMGALFEQQAPPVSLYQVDATAKRMLRYTKSYNFYAHHDCARAAPVRSQGSCGSCFAFATTTVFSARRCRAGKGKAALSPQTVVSCTSKEGRGRDWPCDEQSRGCKGGTAKQAFDFIVDHGVATEARDPYKSGGNGDSTGHLDALSGEIPRCKSAGRGAAKAEGWATVEGDDQIKAAIMKGGPVYVGFPVTKELFKYRRGVWAPRADWKYTRSGRRGTTKGGHAVAIVGWGKSGSKAYWWAQNSWGKEWGIKGFFKMAMTFKHYTGRNKVQRASPLGVAYGKAQAQATFPIVDPDSGEGRAIRDARQGLDQVNANLAKRAGTSGNGRYSKDCNRWTRSPRGKGPLVVSVSSLDRAIGGVPSDGLQFQCVIGKQSYRPYPAKCGTLDIPASKAKGRYLALPNQCCGGARLMQRTVRLPAFSGWSASGGAHARAAQIKSHKWRPSLDEEMTAAPALQLEQVDGLDLGEEPEAAKATPEATGARAGAFRWAPAASIMGAAALVLVARAAVHERRRRQYTQL